ncbi:MAG: nucleotide-binding protein [Cytophagales bacterium]|nr:nucleotide-binding protein [Cytophagales bacterium]
MDTITYLKSEFLNKINNSEFHMDHFKLETSSDSISLIHKKSKGFFKLDLIGKLYAVVTCAPMKHVPEIFSSKEHFNHINDLWVHTENLLRLWLNSLMDFQGLFAENSISQNHSIFLIHGRNDGIKKQLAILLNKLKINYKDWSSYLDTIKKSAPLTTEILDTAFKEATIFLVLLTPDDEVRLNPNFLNSNDSLEEQNIRLQARPNVIFEAGMAYGRNPNTTIFIKVGNPSLFTDIEGKHVITLSNDVSSKFELVKTLENLGCEADTSQTDWMNFGNFELPDSF